MGHFANDFAIIDLLEQWNENIGDDYTIYFSVSNKELYVYNEDINMIIGEEGVLLQEYQPKLLALGFDNINIVEIKPGRHNPARPLWFDKTAMYLEVIEDFTPDYFVDERFYQAPFSVHRGEILQVKDKDKTDWYVQYSKHLYWTGIDQLRRHCRTLTVEEYAKYYV